MREIFGYSTWHQVSVFTFVPVKHVHQLSSLGKLINDEFRILRVAGGSKRVTWLDRKF